MKDSGEIKSIKNDEISEEFIDSKVFNLLVTITDGKIQMYTKKRAALKAVA